MIKTEPGGHWAVGTQPLIFLRAGLESRLASNSVGVIQLWCSVWSSDDFTQSRHAQASLSFVRLMNMEIPKPYHGTHSEKQVLLHCFPAPLPSLAPVFLCYTDWDPRFSPRNQILISVSFFSLPLPYADRFLGVP